MLLHFKPTFQGEDINRNEQDAGNPENIYELDPGDHIPGDEAGNYLEREYNPNFGKYFMFISYNKMQ